MFGAKLKELRLKKDLSLRYLGQKCGISYSFISSLEKGRFNPSRETVLALAEALNVDPNYLLPLAGYIQTESTKTELLKDIDQGVNEDELIKKYDLMNKIREIDPNEDEVRAMIALVRMMRNE